MAAKTRKAAKDIEALTHEQASRKNIPTGEQQSIAERMEEAQPFGPAVYPRAHPLNEGQGGNATRTWTRRLSGMARQSG